MSSLFSANGLLASYVGAGVLDGLAQDALGEPLQVEVEGGVQGAAVDRGGLGAVAEGQPVATADLVALAAVAAFPLNRM